MTRYEVLEYEVIDNFTYFGMLFLVGDRLFIQVKDDSCYRKVFLPSRVYLGKIDQDTFVTMVGRLFHQPSMNE